VALGEPASVGMVMAIVLVPAAALVAVALARVGRGRP
jgi:hypothetical protein